MELNEKQKQLLEFVKESHGEQKRKYTGEPYWYHCYSVAELANSYNIYLGIEIGFCHDLYEDTECYYSDLYSILRHIGYSSQETSYICTCVGDLSDIYTKECFPELNRKERKILEVERLSKINRDAQSVKYCDLIDNTKSIIEHDEKFSKVYLKEAKDILTFMNRGCVKAYNDCLNQINNITNEAN